MAEPLERYRFFKQLSELTEKIKLLVDQQTVLINLIGQLLPQGRMAEAATGPSPTSPLYPEQPRLVTMVSAPVDLVDAQRIEVTPDNVYRYDLTPSDILMLISMDDNIYFAPREFSSDLKGAVALPAGVLLVIHRPSTWSHLWMLSETSSTRVYISEWRYVA